MAKLTIGWIKKSQQTQPRIFLCPELLSGLKNGQTITVQYGQMRTKAKAARLKRTNNVVLSAPVWKALSLPCAHPVHFSLKENQLSIGPLVGILTTGVQRSTHFPVGARTGLFKRFLASQAQIPSSYFVFGPNDIDDNNKKIRATFLRKDKGIHVWQQFVVPFPNVVFDRVPNRTAENRPAVQKARRVLEQSGVRIFNPGFFNKWTIHRSIQDRQEAQPFIPETLFDPTPLQITYLLEKHRMIYLKPANGSLGLGILKLYHVPGQGFFIRYRQGNENKLKKFPDLASVLNHILNRSSVTYIAQQGIRLLKLKDRQIDFRVHTNKNRHDNWNMTAVAAKIAGKGSVTTHMRTGGKVLSYKDVLDRCFGPAEREKVLQQLENAVLTLSSAIEDSLPGHFGEFGFDIGIDEHGHPWMFEANSKPGRHVFLHSSMKKSEQMTRNLILDYALYLSEFTTKDVSSS